MYADFQHWRTPEELPAYIRREFYMECTLAVKKANLEHASGASEEVFELTPSRAAEKALLASGQPVRFIFSEKEYISSSKSFLNLMAQYI